MTKSLGKEVLMKYAAYDRRCSAKVPHKQANLCKQAETIHGPGILQCTDVMFLCKAQGRGGRFPDDRKHKGEPELSSNVFFTCSFYFFRAACSCFWRRIPLLRCCAAPIRGQEQTYFFER
jgi:hypothetical protein